MRFNILYIENITNNIKDCILKFYQVNTKILLIFRENFKLLTLRLMEL